MSLEAEYVGRVFGYNARFVVAIQDGLLSAFQPLAYGPVFAELLSVDRCRLLGPGRPNKVLYEPLRELTAVDAFAHRVDKGGGLENDDMAILCCAATWLINDYLDESHAIIQKVSNHSGSYWHGIVHRREGDFSNAKHWFRQAGGHPVLTSLGTMVHRQFSDASDEKSEFALWTVQGTWNPETFVDLCQQLGKRGTVAAVDLYRRVQQWEWELLFDHCFQQAAGEA